MGPQYSDGPIRSQVIEKERQGSWRDAAARDCRLYESIDMQPSFRIVIWRMMLVHGT